MKATVAFAYDENGMWCVRGDSDNDVENGRTALKFLEENEMSASRHTLIWVDVELPIPEQV